MAWFKRRTKEPEEFPDEYRYQSGLRAILKQNEEQHANLLKEIKENRVSHQSIVQPIVSKILELQDDVKLAIELLNQSSKETVDTTNISDRIVALLSQTESMSFTELLDTLGVARTTLTRHLEKLQQEGKIERIETDKIVLYRLRKVNA